ncbi:COG3904 family protein [Devosia sp. CAU 1758]
MKSDANARAASDAGPFYRHMIAKLAQIEDGAILRFAFFTLLAGTMGVLYVDYRELSAGAPEALTFAPQPILPPATTEDGGGRARPALTTAPEVLDEPLRIELGSNGELSLTGTIDPGAAQRFEDEIAARGEYVSTVLLDSPGGSVDDALEIGRLILERGLSTEVRDGKLCASSCPVILASGTERIAGRDAAIGVHQIYAAALSGTTVDALSVAGVAMADAQLATAEITRHLNESGVDSALWLHALETPPDRLYYLSPEEMEQYRLVTEWAQN